MSKKSEGRGEDMRRHLDLEEAQSQTSEDTQTGQPASRIMAATNTTTDTNITQKRIDCRSLGWYTSHRPSNKRTTNTSPITILLSFLGLMVGPDLII